MDVLFQSPPSLVKPSAASSEMTQVPTPVEQEDPSLSRWFRILHDRVRLSDRHSLNSQNVRVESSAPSDWWIHVHPNGLKQHERCGFFGHHACMASADDSVALFKELREALLVTSMLARIDYAAWYEEMHLTSGLRLTKAQREERFECKFAFTLEGSATPQHNAWRDKIDALWGLRQEGAEATQDELSKEFLSSVVELHAIAKTKNVKWSDVIQPLPVRFEFSEVAATADAQAAALHGVTDAVQHARRASVEKAEGIQGVLPLFQLQTLELYLWRHDAHPIVFNALERLLETDVPINFLALPGRDNRDGVDQDTLLRAWRSLIPKVFASSHNVTAPTQLKVQLDRLEIPSLYLTPPLSASWLQALASATNVRSLSIQGHASPMMSTSVFWQSIANAFFSHTARNSIQSLELAGLGDISAEAIAEFERSAGHRQSETHEPAQAALQTLVFRLGPGPQPTPGLDGSLDVGPKQWIPRILQLAGQSLTALAIDRADVDDVMLEQCLRACPKLESLRINGASLQSLDALVGAYDRPTSSQLASVELRSVIMPIDAFETLLSTLADDTKAIHSTLRRLRVGEGWSSAFRKSTVDALKELLNTNQTLATVQVYRPVGPFSSIRVADWDRLKAHDGSFLAEVDSPLQLQSRLAFLGSLRRLSGENVISPVAEDPLRLIIDFAAKARRRSVVILPDVSQVQY